VNDRILARLRAIASVLEKYAGWKLGLPEINPPPHITIRIPEILSTFRADSSGSPELETSDPEEARLVLNIGKEFLDLKRRVSNLEARKNEEAMN